VDADRYEIEFTGISIAAGRATGPVAGVRARGRLSELLRRIKRASTDLQFFPMPYPCGSPTLLIERASFD
jgi:predicted Zn-dependent protease